MYRILLTLAFMVCMAENTCSQTSEDLFSINTMIKIKELINNDRNDEASVILDRMEKQGIDTAHDSIRVLFYEDKGVILFYDDKYNDCIPYFQKAISLYEKLNIKAQNYLDDFMAIGFSYGMMKDYDNAERYYRKALLKSTTAECKKDFQPSVYKKLGDLYMLKGDSALAEECYTMVADGDKAAAEDNEFISMDYINWEAARWDKINKLVDEKKYEDAVKEYAVFCDELKKKKGVTYESYLVAVNCRAMLLSRYLHRTDEALPLYKELTEIADKLPKGNETICNAFCNLVLCYSKTNRQNELKEAIRDGLEYLKKANIENFPPFMIYRMAGNGAYWQKDYPNAIKYYEQYIGESKDNHEGGTNFEDIANMLSVSYLLSNMPGKAKDLLLDVVKGSERMLKKDNISLLANIYHNLGRAYMMQGDKKKALTFLNRSSEIQQQVFGKTTERTLQYINECKSR